MRWPLTILGVMVIVGTLTFPALAGAIEPPFLDRFTEPSYDGDDGTLRYNGPWVEVGEDSKRRVESDHSLGDVHDVGPTLLVVFIDIGEQEPDLFGHLWEQLRPFLDEWCHLGELGTFFL